MAGVVLPDALAGHPHRGGYVCAEWELRVTARCAVEDLGAAADATFEDLLSHEIVAGLVKDRQTRTNDTREVSPLTCGKQVWVLARGNDHRGGTWFDEENRVVWLLAYGLHRSDEPDDFFPYCKGLDQEARLLPSEADYERLIRDRDYRFAQAVTIEAPLILQQAREAPGEEHKVMLGGKYGACVAIEVDEEVEVISIAFLIASAPYEYLEVILAAIQPGDWEDADSLPSRELDMDREIGFCLLRTRTSSS